MVTQAGPKPKRKTYSRGYMRFLVLALSAAAIFQGFDAALASVAVRDLESTFGVEVSELGLAIPTLAIAAGTLFAWPASALADRFGRKPVVVWSTAGFAVFTGLTAVSTTPEGFAGFQFLARVCLVTQMVVALTFVAEVVPARSRGSIIGLMGGIGALGLPVASYLSAVLGPGSFKGLFVLGAAGLVPAIILNRSVESESWVFRRRGGTRLLQGPFRSEVALISFGFLATNFALWGAATAWPFHASTLDFSSSTIESLIGAGLIAGALGHLAAGVFSDRLGRRRVGTAFLVLAGISGSLLFRAETPEASLPLILAASFFGFGATTIFDAIAIESVPSRLRAQTLGLARGVFVIVGAIGGTAAVSALAGDGDSQVSTLGDSASIVVLVFLVAALILRRLPETSGKELEKISAAVPAPVPEFAYGPRDKPSEAIIPEGRPTTSPSPRIQPRPTRDWTAQRSDEETWTSDDSTD